MAYDKSSEQRIDALIAAWPDIEKKRMFGGVCYLLNGNICFGIWQESLIVRTDEATAQEMLRRKQVRPFDVTGRPMKGWLLVAAAGWPTEADLDDWLVMGRTFALTLPKK